MVRDVTRWLSYDCLTIRRVQGIVCALQPECHEPRYCFLWMGQGRQGERTVSYVKIALLLLRNDVTTILFATSEGSPYEK